MSKTIVVTGSMGFIGSNFCHWLIDNTDHVVIGIDNASTGYPDNPPPYSDRFVQFIEDVTNAKSLEGIFENNTPFVCFHFAAYAAEGRSNNIRSFIHQNNTVGTANIINACVKHKCKLVFTSSVAVYSGLPPFDESTIPNPIDEYGLSKYTSELSIKIAGQLQGLDWCIVRPRNVYGEKQSIWDEARNLFGIFCYNALHCLPLTVFGDGTNKRCFTYVGDILEPLYNAIKYHHQIINLGSEKAYTINEAAHIFSVVSGYNNIVHTEPRHEVSEAVCLVEKSKQLLGFEDKTGLYAGLKNMWQWAKQQPDRPKQTPPKLEVETYKHSSVK